MRKVGKMGQQKKGKERTKEDQKKEKGKRRVLERERERGKGLQPFFSFPHVHSHGPQKVSLLRSGGEKEKKERKQKERKSGEG